MKDTEDAYSFFEEEDRAGEAGTVRDFWKVLVVDDDAELQRATKSALAGFVFQDKELELLFAFSAAQAKQILCDNADTAVILLDVVMEDDLAGLNLVKYIRDELKNRYVRILLRTGQPGIAPEKSVIVDYDINGFLEKSDLTIQKLYTALITCLRSYRDIMDLEKAGKALAEEFQKRLEAEKIAAQQAQQAAMGLAISQIMHGAKNILNALKGGKYLIDSALKSNNVDLVKQGWDITKIGISRMETLTSDLLSLSRFNKLQLKPGSLNTLINEIVKSYEVKHTSTESKPVEITAETDETLPDVLFDQYALHTAVLNLLSNAVDACKDKIFTADDCEFGRVAVRTHFTGESCAVIEVEDNGCGIKQEDIARIYNLFYSTKHSRGNGLGLSITKKIIKEHGGKLDVYSEIGKGTTFQIKLPLAKKELLSKLV
ncbi:MAG: response regulator [Nitrospirae bacterium]|nr:response regulator [Nitrospirota bacterium]